MSSTFETQLNGAIGIATDFESEVMAQPDVTPFQAFVLGTVVRLRRYAEATVALGERFNYEARVIIRSGLEIHYNYLWARLNEPEDSAVRFLLYDVVERLRAAEDLNSGIPERSLAAGIRSLTAQRAELEDMFLVRTPGGSRWSSHWARTTSLAERIKSVQTSTDEAEPADKYMYGLYRWFSSTVHGGPMSIGDVVDLEGDRPAPKAEKDLISTSSQEAALIILASTLERASEDLDLPKLRTASSELYRAIKLRVLVDEAPHEAA